jgi:hypothetical protein
MYICEGAMLPDLKAQSKGGMIMLTKVGIAIALAALLAVPSASFAASKAKSSSSPRDVTKCEGGGCTAANPDRDPNTSLKSQYYRRSHKKHKSQ